MAYGDMMYLTDELAFLEACGSAKVVEDANGDDVLLVGGKIVKVEPAYLAVSIAKALRRSVPATSEG